MDFHFENNTIKIIHQNKTFHLHPIWLRERLPGEKYFDLDTNQRLYEPSSIDLKLKIISCKLSDHKLDVEFNDGAQGLYHLNDLLIEMDEEKNKRGPLPKRILWNSQLEVIPQAIFEEGMVEKFDNINVIFE